MLSLKYGICFNQAARVRAHKGLVLLQAWNAGDAGSPARGDLAGLTCARTAAAPVCSRMLLSQEPNQGHCKNGRDVLHWPVLYFTLFLLCCRKTHCHAKPTLRSSSFFPHDSHGSVTASVQREFSFLFTSTCICMHEHRTMTQEMCASSFRRNARFIHK